MTFFLELLVGGLAVGAIYGVVALGWVLIYKASNVLNFAQGEFLLLSAYLLWTLVLPAGLPVWLSFVITFAFAVFLGLLVERLLLRPLIGEPVHAVIMLTMGLMVMVRAVVVLLWGGASQSLPAILPKSHITLGGFSFSQQYLWSFVVSLLVFVVFALFFKYTKQGLAMRAAAADQQVAQAMGVRVTQILAMAWIISMVVAAIGGFLIGTILGVSPLASVVGLKVLSVVMVGGLESVLGAAIAGPLIGALENIAGGYLNPLVGGGVNEIAPFVVLLLILFIKPYGLFGLQRIERI